MAHEETQEKNGHTATVVEQGRFCLARCTCGWRGPARRARSRARTDAEEHTAEHSGAHAGEHPGEHTREP
ncbi:hypothetical protein [Streptomyces sp. NPDC050145]|uniref:hypothetical protein n=1 Tax=Streptomyces sp. NPDC050145 TaxID=3365602 RepID=UPI00379B52C5